MGEGAPEVSSLTGLAVAGITGGGNHESAVGPLVTHVQENLRGNLATEESSERNVSLQR